MATQLDIQNALRILSSIVPKGVTLEFGFGDLVTIDHSPKDGQAQIMRTQELAELLYEKGLE